MCAFVCVCVTGTGVTVNAVHPGIVATELGRHTGMHQSTFSSSILSEYPTSLLDSEFREINTCLPNAYVTISSGSMNSDMQHLSA